MTTRTRAALTGALLLLLAILPAAAQPDPRGDSPAGDPEMDRELREAMQHYFQKRLRAALALSDEQMEEISPRLEALERNKAEARRGRMETARRLQRDLRRGASDGQLQQLLDRLDRIEREQQELQRGTMQEIDAVLSVRQRVQLRFFIQRFQREFAQRVRELRGARGRP